MKKLTRIKTGVVVMLIMLFFSNLQAQNEVRKNQYGKTVTRVAMNAEMRNGILTFESDDQNFKFWFDNRVFLDAAYFGGETLNPIGSGLNIRRARFAVKALLYKHWYGELDLDFAYAQMELKDLYIAYKGKNWNVKAGNFKESFSMETTTTSRYISFIERSLLAKMAPSRHLGFQANLWGEKYLLIGGLHFQEIGELEQITFSKDANKDNGINEGYSLTGRAVYRPIRKENMVLHLGVAGSYRTPKTDLEVPNSYRLSTRALTSINRKKYLDTDDILNVNYNTLLGAELAFSWKNIMFQSEYSMSNLTRFSNSPNAKFEGFYAQAGYILYGGSYVYDNAQGEFTQINRGKTWGDIELAFRYSYLNLNDFDAKIYGGAGEEFTFGVNYHVNNNVKLMLNYSYLNHDRFANGKGKLVIYKDENGIEYKDPMDVEIPAGEGGDDFGFISARIEIDF